jgi:hypothetical protein
MNIEFPLAAKVRFTQKRLSILTPRDRQGLAGRIGITQTDSTFVSKPTVYFPTDGPNLEIRLFRVDPSHLEMVELPPNTEIASKLNESENHFDLSPAAADVEATVSAADGGGILSPNEIDNLFD